MRITLAAVIVASLVLPATASAADYSVGGTSTASPATSPLANPCPVQADNPPDQINWPNTEVEPQVAVNPTNANNVIGVFQEDRWTDGGAHGLLAAVSFNGGAGYINDWAEFSACSDIPATPEREELPRATDPWVSFDAAGRAYQVGLPIIDGSLAGESAVTASHSTDGGLHWSAPVDITRDDPATDPGVFNDKQSITADPAIPGRAYVTWIQGNLPGENISFAKLSHAFSYRGMPMFSRTVDGGQTWSAPKAMTNANLYAQGNQIAVLPDGTLIDVMAILFKGAGVQPNPNGVYMAVMRSQDGGLHWSNPTQIAKLGTVGETADGQPLRVGDYLPDIAVDRQSGALYVTWADGLGGATNKIVLSRSTDGGRHWTTPQIVSHHNGAQSFNHAVAVANDGDVAVLYYDIARNDGNPGIPTDIYLRHSGTGGTAWSAPLRLGSFDFSTAPVARGLFVGDYMGLEPIGPRGLVAFTGVTDSTPHSANVLSVRLNR